MIGFLWWYEIVEIYLDFVEFLEGLNSIVVEEIEKGKLVWEKFFVFMFEE